MSKNTSSSSQADRDNRANQLNSQHEAYHQSRGSTPDGAAQQAEAERTGASEPSGGEAPSPAPGRALKK
jgi:hypothetical protein